MSESISAVVLIEFDGQELTFAQSTSTVATRAQVDMHGNIYVLADISPEPVTILLKAQQQGLALQSIAAWPVLIEPVVKTYVAEGPILGTPFMLERNPDGGILLIDDHEGRLGQFSYRLKVDFKGETLRVDPEIENRGESGWPPEL